MDVDRTCDIVEELAALNLEGPTRHEAVAAFESADEAHEAEMAATSACATHVERSRRAAEAARRFVAELTPSSSVDRDRRPFVRRVRRPRVRVTS